MRRYTTRIAARVERLAPIHLHAIPKRVYRACSGPYSSCP